MIYVETTKYTPEQQRENLIALAAGLLTMPPPNIRFNMRNFDGHWDNDNSTSECGAVACAVGCATHIVEPRALVCVDTDYVMRYGRALPLRYHECWWDYSVRVFGHAPGRYNDSAGEWMFGSLWWRVDNSAKGAAKRILWFLEYGLPDDWERQMCGAVPLCYVD